MFANFLIGLREGLEASLVVSLLLAYLIRTKNTSAIKPMWFGVLIAISLSIGVAALLTFTSARLSFESQEAFGGIMSLVAVGFVTWMIFWMKKMGHHLKKDLEEKMEDAIAAGTVAIATLAFISVAREGIETSLFFWTSLQSSQNSVGNNSLVPLWGFLIGIFSAIALAMALYKKLLKINLGKFFSRTGMLLIFVAAGIAAYGVHDLQEAGLIPGIQNRAFDATAVLNPNSIHGALFRGIIPISPQPTWLEISVFVLYIGVVLSLYIRKPKSPSVLKKVVPAATMLLISMLVLGACSSSSKASSKLEVTSSKKSCEITNKEVVKVGSVELILTNTGSKVTEVHVEQNDKIVDELESVTPNQTRNRIMELKEGTYVIRCKPGMIGDGFTTELKVQS